VTQHPARIRRARASDAARIVEMEKHFPSDRLSDRAIRRFLRSPRADVLVAVERGAALANLILLKRSNSRVARIYSIVVDQHGRGRGLAKRLVARAEALARKAGCEAVALEVRSDNLAARGLYARLGYVEVKALPAFYDDGADGLRLCKKIGSRS
jgi:ribosomal protein S18 acetylase RimI-like enzyme